MSNPYDIHNPGVPAADEPVSVMGAPAAGTSARGALEAPGGNQTGHSSGGPDGGRRVLIIEDNIDAAESLRDVLELDGFRVELAFDGAQGVERAREFHPDVVLCDIGLPVMDGYEVARAIRADSSLDGVFLVALSGYARPEDVDRAIEAGFHRHLAKPPPLEKLEEVVLGAAAP